MLVENEKSPLTPVNDVDGTAGRSRVKPVFALAASVVAFALVVVARESGYLYGTWVLVLFGILVVLIPVSRHLSGRILWTLTVVFGFVPLLWWVPLKWPANVRSTLLIAAAVGLVAYFAMRSASSPGGLRRMLPQVRALDFVPLAAAAGGVFVWLPGLMARRVEDAMSLLLMSWDNASHFDIYHMQRTLGTVLPLAGPAGDGSRWSFADYPQGYHSALVLVTEMARSSSGLTGDADVVNFTNFTAVTNIAIIALVVAAVCSLPALRSVPVIGIPVAVFVGSGWLFGPGALASMHGYSNFLFTTALVVAAIVLCQSMTRVLEPLPLFAVGACVSGVMQNWVPLGAFLIPSVLAVLFVTPKGRWRASGAERLAAAAVAVLVCVAAATAASQLLTVKADGILFATGGLPELDFGTLIAYLGLLAAASLVLGLRNGGRPSPASRTQWSLGAVWLGVLIALGMGVAQVAKTGSLTYYMEKFSIALELVVLAGLALAVNGLLARWPVAGFARSRNVTAASAVLTLGLTQIFGFVFPLAARGLSPSAVSGVQLQQQQTAVAGGSVGGARIIDAVRRSVNLTGPVMYLTTNPNDVDVILAQQWFDGLRGNYTEHGWNLSLNMFPLSEGEAKLPEVVKAIKAADPHATIVVDPEHQKELDQILASLP